jgi:hypothetical protein
MSATTGHAENPYAGQGSVLLDIGDDVGAVVVTMPDGMEGVEVEVRLEGGPERGGDDGTDRVRAHHPHVAVVPRPVRGGWVPSLVFPEVKQGRYGLYLKDRGTRIVGVTVRGGEVTHLSWPPGSDVPVDT